MMPANTKARPNSTGKPLLLPVNGRLVAPFDGGGTGEPCGPTGGEVMSAPPGTVDVVVEASAVVAVGSDDVEPCPLSGTVDVDVDVVDGADVLVDESGGVDEVDVVEPCSPSVVEVSGPLVVVDDGGVVEVGAADVDVESPATVVEEPGGACVVVGACVVEVGCAVVEGACVVVGADVVDGASVVVGA